MSSSLWHYGLYPARRLCPWYSPGKNRGVGSCALLQGIFLAQGSNLASFMSLALAGMFFTTSTTWEALSDGIPIAKEVSVTEWIFPGGSGKEPACNAGDPGLILGSGRFPWRRKCLLTPVFLPGESHWQRILAWPWCRKESDRTEWLILSLMNWGKGYVFRFLFCSHTHRPELVLCLLAFPFAYLSLNLKLLEVGKHRRIFYLEKVLDGKVYLTISGLHKHTR